MVLLRSIAAPWISAIRLKSDGRNRNPAVLWIVKPRHTHLIRKSFAAIEVHGPIAALIFYQELFERDPALRRLFQSDIEIQGKKLTEMLGTLISLLERGPALETELKAMGARHATYGVTEAHYATVKAALMAMLEQILGDGFKGEVREAWTQLYDKVEKLMKQGAATAVMA